MHCHYVGVEMKVGRLFDGIHDVDKLLAFNFQRLTGNCRFPPLKQQRFRPSEHKSNARLTDSYCSREKRMKDPEKKSL